VSARSVVSGRVGPVPPLTLALDASTYAGSVAVVRGAAVLAECAPAMRGEREERLMPAVAGALRAAGISPLDVERIACGAGPGSFTSLRIAASIAKGLAAGVGCPLVAVGSLLLVVAGTLVPLAPGRYLALLDAMRGEHFAARVELCADGTAVQQSDTLLVSSAEVPALAERLEATPVGPGQRIDAVPHARGVARLTALVDTSTPVDLAAWEPEYGRLAEAQVKWEAAHGRALPRL
jgi:tRNA threonylcarbamoyladenosine biosynthesis protein TsaB